MHGFCVAAGGTLCNDRGLLTRLIFDVCMYTRYIYSGKYRRVRGSVSVCVRLRVARARVHAAARRWDTFGNSVVLRGWEPFESACR